MKPMLIVACAAVGMLACAPGGSGGAMAKMNDPADLAALNQVRSDWQAAFNAGDMAKLASLYTSDAHTMGNGIPTTVGGEATAQANGAMLAQMSSARVELTAEKTEVAGDIAYDRGTYRTTATPKGGAETTEEGRYLVILRRQADGSWKLVEDMSNLPTAPAPPAPPSKGK